MYGIAKFQFLSEKQDLLLTCLLDFILFVSIDKLKFVYCKFSWKKYSQYQMHCWDARSRLSVKYLPFVYCSIVLSLKSDNVDMIQQLV